MSTSLNVWMNGEQVGVWTVDRGSHAFAYADAWLRSDNVRPLSLSLPITASKEIRGEVVTHFFDNLLPDNERIRQRLKHRFNIRNAGTFSSNDLTRGYTISI